VDAVPDLELGGAEELPIGLGGEQLGDPLDFALDGRQQASLDPVGLIALLGRQVEWEAGHGQGLP
jgi:hypothetical protein